KGAPPKYAGAHGSGRFTYLPQFFFFLQFDPIGVGVILVMEDANQQSLLMHVPAAAAKRTQLAGFVVIVTLGHCHTHLFCSRVDLHQGKSSLFQ
ncbi:hypothetical protein KUT65_26225, partial [Pseudomonas aeruginosa]|nr:hypothetical protein [Pseudomonas aeruginosa]